MFFPPPSPEDLHMSSQGFFTLGWVKLEVKAQMSFFYLQRTRKKVFNGGFVLTNHIAWINLPNGQLETCPQSITGLGGKVGREEKALLLSLLWRAKSLFLLFAEEICLLYSLYSIKDLLALFSTRDICNVFFFKYFMVWKSLELEKLA